MKVEYILAYQHKLIDAVVHHQLKYLALHQHNIVIDSIVPFTYQFDNGIAALIVGKQYF